MKKFFSKAWLLIKASYKEFAEDDTWTLGAALSYYTVFSMAPVLIIVIYAAGMIFGYDAVQGQVFGQIKAFIGAEGAAQVQDMLKSAYKPHEGIIASLFAGVLLIFGATTVFYQLQAALNKIWEVKPKPKRGYIKYLKDRFLSFGLIIGVGFVLLVSLVVNAAMVALSNYLKSFIPDISLYLFQIIEFVLSLGIITLLFALIFRYLPDAKVKWRDVWIGALVTAVLFTISRYGIGFYLSKSNVASSYGAAGFIILVLLWVNYSSQIMFFGAEFTQVYAQEYGSMIRPAEYAVRVKNLEVEQKDNETTRQFEKKVQAVKETGETPPEKLKVKEEFKPKKPTDEVKE